MHTGNKPAGRGKEAGHAAYIPQMHGGHINLWDTQYFGPSRAFSVFREGIGNTFMPWTPEFNSERPFEARIESMNFAEGSVGRVRMSPLVTVRTKQNIAASKVDGFYANFVMTGELNVEQGGHVSRAVPGDLVIYDTAEPVSSTGQPDSMYEDLSFLISKKSFAAVKNAETAFRNVLLPRRSLMGPLAGSLALLSEHLLTATADELTALFDAFVVLLPLAAGGFAANLNDGEESKSRDLRREILYYVNEQLSAEELSPERVATHFGICPRYVHKIFASMGTTFSAYITQKRLERVRLDLVSPSCKHESIFSVAYRWGFINLSTFIRLFKKRYGCTPSEFRAAHGL
jgi:AraC-like DNA-binding protein